MADAGSGQGPGRDIVHIDLDEKSFVRRRPEVEHERSVAIYDLLQENDFRLVGDDTPDGPYRISLALEDDRLVFDVRDDGDQPLKRVAMAVKPFRRLVKDYFIVCETYFSAIKTQSPSRIEAIDMGRRALHNEGAELLKDRLSSDVEMDTSTARRLFTLFCVLHVRG